MCQERRFQPMFRVRFDRSPPEIQMYSHIMKRDGTHNIESMAIANWAKSKTPLGIYWEGKNTVSRLKMSDTIIDRFIPRYCTSQRRCCLCSSDCSKPGAKSKSQNDTVQIKGTVIKPADTPVAEQYTCRYNQSEDIKKKQKITYPTVPENYTKIKYRSLEKNMKAGYEPSKLNVYDRG